MIDLSWLNEPVRRAAVIKAAITILAVAGVSLTTTQQDAIQNFAAAGAFLIAAFGVFDFKVLRNKVTPVADPALPVNTVVNIVDSRGYHVDQVTL